MGALAQTTHASGQEPSCPESSNPSQPIPETYEQLFLQGSFALIVHEIELEPPHAAEDHHTRCHRELDSRAQVCELVRGSKCENVWCVKCLPRKCESHLAVEHEPHLGADSDRHHVIVLVFQQRSIDSGPKQNGEAFDVPLGRKHEVRAQYDVALLTQEERTPDAATVAAHLLAPTQITQLQRLVAELQLRQWTPQQLTGLLSEHSARTEQHRCNGYSRHPYARIHRLLPASSIVHKKSHPITS